MLSILSRCALVALLLTPAAELSAAEVRIDEWPVPWERTRPRDPYVAPDGRIWFNGQGGHYIAVLDPMSGDMQRVDLPDEAGPHNLIVDDRGIVWYAGNLLGYIGRYDPADGSFQRFPMPREDARDPHTLVFGPGGDIWFTLQRSNMLGRFDPASGEVQLVEVTTPRARPYGILPDADGVWVVLLGTNRLARWDLDGSYREVALPEDDIRPRRLALVDGVVWYCDYAGGRLGRYDPADGSHQLIAMPSGDASQPYAMASDDRGRLWLSETGPSPIRLVAYDPASGTWISETEVPSGAGSIRHMVFDAEARVIWFGTDANTVGRAQVPD